MELQNKIKQAVKKAFPGSKLTLEITMPGSKKLCGVLVWPKFLGLEQSERQKKLWKVLEKELTAPELQRLTVILTFTREETAVAGEA